MDLILNRVLELPERADLEVKSSLVPDGQGELANTDSGCFLLGIKEVRKLFQGVGKVRRHSDRSL